MVMLCLSKFRTSTSVSFSTRITWSSISDHSRRTTLVPPCSINRYYDPSTDSFMSVDPDLQSTDQAFVFTNDNPLNSTDPLGIDPCVSNGAVVNRCPNPGIGISSSQANGISLLLVTALRNNGISISNSAATAISRAIKKDTSLSGVVISQGEFSTLLKDVGATAAKVAVATDLVQAYVTSIDDAQAGHGIVYSLGDAGVSYLAGAFGFAKGVEACEEAGYWSVVCGVGGALAGSGVVHWMFGRIF